MRRLLSLLLLAAVVSGCQSMPGDAPVFSGLAEDLPAPPGRISRFAFVADGTAEAPLDTGRLVPVADSLSLAWDLGLRGTEIVLNGGSSGPGAGVGVVLAAPFDQVGDALRADAFYRRDGESPCPSGPARGVCTAPGDGWFETMALPGGGTAVVPIPGRTLLLRLGDGAGYAKVEVLSYYRGAPDVDAIGAGSDAGFYTLRFTVDPGGASFVAETE